MNEFWEKYYTLEGVTIDEFMQSEVSTYLMGQFKDHEKQALEPIVRYFWNHELVGRVVGAERLEWLSQRPDEFPSLFLEDVIINLRNLS
jgi:hypothetical protein